MNAENRGMALLELIRQGFLMQGQNNSKLVLGNRASYAGLSDLASYGQCPRQAVLNKYNPAEPSLAQALTMHRGHWFEACIGQCFTNLGFNVLPQLEISFTHKSIPLKAHFDFTLVSPEPCATVRILEIKSVKTLVSEPYQGHEQQTQRQINLLCKFWNRPVFSLRNSAGEILYGRLTFPQLCHEHSGIALPRKPEKISVESWLLYVSMTDARAFGPYIYQDNSWEKLHSEAAGFWQMYKQLQQGLIKREDLPYAKCFHPLCAYCQFNTDCPKFAAQDNQPQWEAALHRLDTLKTAHQSMDNDIKEAHKLSGVKGWINTGLHKFMVSTLAGRKSLDKQQLHQSLQAIFEDAHIEDIDINDLLVSCEKIGSPSTRLNIIPAN